jgi:hypothetical protein
MTTPEDRLAKLLREQADTLQPAGDGLSKIQSRLATRRKARWFVVPSAALATTAAVTAFFVLGGSGQQTTLVGPVGGSPSPTCRAVADYQAGAGCPRPSSSPGAVTDSPTPTGFFGQPFAPAIWPFASGAQTQAWRANPSSKPWAESNLGVAQHFVDDYLQLTGVHLVQTCVSCDVVGIVNADGKDVGDVLLVREDDGSPRAFSVAGVSFNGAFALTSPQEGTKVTSPLTVTGTVTGVDENVSIDLLSQTGVQLAHTTAPAGSAQPWSGQLTWTDTNWYTGALVLKTYSLKDGSLTRVVVRRVVRGT